VVTEKLMDDLVTAAGDTVGLFDAEPVKVGAGFDHGLCEPGAAPVVGQISLASDLVNLGIVSGAYFIGLAALGCHDSLRCGAHCCPPYAPRFR
jgi:hypothetical protein